MNCQKCIHSGPVPNSIHCSCQHPAIDRLRGDGELLLIFLKALLNDHRVIQLGAWNFNLELNHEMAEYAINNGYFIFPFNYDPRWIDSCTGYEGDEIRECGGEKVC